MKNKYILTDDQVMVLDNIHKRIIEGALIRMGIPYAEHNRFLTSSQKTFDLLIEEAQKTLTEIGGTNEVMDQLKK